MSFRFRAEGSGFRDVEQKISLARTSRESLRSGPWSKGGLSMPSYRSVGDSSVSLSTLIGGHWADQVVL